MSRDEKSHPEDLDGWRKNAAKLSDEFDKVKDAVKGAGDSHDPFTNAAVEASRASPYFMGHVLVIGGIVLIGIIIALIALN